MEWGPGGRSSSLLPALLLFSLLLRARGYAPVVCNEGTDYACRCRNDTASGAVDCSLLIKSYTLPTVDMRIRHVNLESTLHTGEKYEHYFKKRIAAIVSAFCERHANECPGTDLRMVPPANATVLYAVDKDEPLLSQENVLILRAQREPLNITRLLFVVVRSATLRTAAPLTPEDLVDPVKVKYILGSQTAPLERVLGGIRIDSVRVTEMDGAPRADAGDNTKLRWMVGIVAAFFVVCYAIGAVKLYREHQARKKKRATEVSKIVVHEEAKKPANYGAIELQTTQLNGRSPLQAPSPFSETHKSSACTSEETSFATVTRPRVLSDRQARLMFGCDPSQLPKEQSFDEGLRDSPAQTRPAHGAVPALVLLSERDTPLSVSQEGPVETGILTREDSVPSHRPKSRRGSRVDDTGETIDLTERFPDAELQIPEIASCEPQPEDAWSSSEGEVDIYYKLSEEDEVKGDQWPDAVIPQDEPNKVVLRAAPRKTTVAEESSEDEEPPEEPHEGLHAYERLREDLSPVPPREAVVNGEVDSDEDSLR